MKNSVSFLILLQKDRNQMHEFFVWYDNYNPLSVSGTVSEKMAYSKATMDTKNLSRQMKVSENHSKFHVQFSMMVSQYMDTIKNMK